MAKTLHDYFYINTGQKTEAYGAKESSALIEAANIHIERKNGNDSQNTIPLMETFIYECMDEYHKNGFSDNLLPKLNTILLHVKVQCLVENIENKLTAVHAAYMPKSPDPLVFAAYMFSNVASLGGLEKLKRCQKRDCLKFFIGRPNSKWCSNTCGSIYRVKKMRKKKAL